MRKKVIYGLVAATVGTSTYLYLDQPTPFHVYIHGSDNYYHDVELAESVDSDTTLDLLCVFDPEALEGAKRGDVVMSARADSYECGYIDPKYLTYPIVSGGNYPAVIMEKQNPNAIFVSNGYTSGPVVDIYVNEHNQGDANAKVANGILAINEAREEIGREVYSIYDLKETLRESGKEKYIDGLYVGVEADFDKALEIATAATSTPVACNECGFLPAIYSLLMDK